MREGWSISTKWLLLQAGFFLMVLVVAGVLLYVGERREVRRGIQSGARVTIQGFSELIADNPGLMKGGALQPSVWRFVRKQNNIARMSVIDFQLVVVADSEAQNVGRVTEQNAFIGVLRDGRMKRFQYQSGGREHLRLTAPMYGPYDPVRKSRLIGGMSIDVDLSRGAGENQRGLCG